MESKLPTVTEIDQLIDFLPRLYGERAEPICVWRGGAESSGLLRMPYPVYAPDVEAFFMKAGAPCWSDYDYSPDISGAMLADPTEVQNADFGQIKTMLTYCVRGERFVSGFWEQVIREGAIRMLLERLAVLR